jgi:hypothetical protein
MNSSAIIEWLNDNQNLNKVSVIQQGVSLLIGLAIFIKSYDFESMLSSVKRRREDARKEKEKQKIIKFKRLFEMSKSGVAIDIEKVNLSSEQDDDEEKLEPIMRVAHKKIKIKKDNNIV